MEKHEVVGDVIDVTPNEILEVDYGNGAILDLGNELTPTQVQKPPKSIKWTAEVGAMYTLCMIDPDAPSRQDPSRGEVKHWLVVNIPGNDISKGETLAEFIGSGPPLGSGLHRYVFLIFKQPSGKIAVPDKPVSNKSLDGRFNFKTRQFASEYNLGNPVAGNLYLAKYDEYVPILHAQFTE